MRYCVKPASVHELGREQESLLVASHSPMPPRGRCCLHTSHQGVTLSGFTLPCFKLAHRLQYRYTTRLVMNIIYTFRFTHYRSNLLCICSQSLTLPVMSATS